MRKNLLMMCLPLVAATFAVQADSVEMPAETPAAAPAPTTLPARGVNMKAVSQQFGAPSKKYAAVGGGRATHPPITRWDYPGFSVFFERSRVIKAVVPGQPPELRNTEQLQAN